MATERLTPENKIIVLLELYNRPMGRYKLSEITGIPEGVLRSFLKRLTENNLCRKYGKKGHDLSEKGKKFVEKIKKSIVNCKHLDAKDLTISRVDFACQIRGIADKIDVTKTVEVRDIALIAGSTGATTILFEEGELQIPCIDFRLISRWPIVTGDLYHNFNLKNGDVIIVATGRDLIHARRGALAAALSLIGPFGLGSI